MHHCNICQPFLKKERKKKPRNPRFLPVRMFGGEMIDMSNLELVILFQLNPSTRIVVKMKVEGGTMYLLSSLSPAFLNHGLLQGG